MKITGYCFLLLFAALNVFAQQEKKVDSRITNVTVFLNKAQITREIKTRIEAGKTTLVITGLSSQIDKQSLQVAGKGAFIILGLSHQQNFLTELNVPKSLQTLRDSVELIQQQLAVENSQKEILKKEEQMLLSNQKIGGANQNLTVAELKAMADFYRSRLSDIVLSQMKQDQKIRKLTETVAKLQRQLNEQTDLYSRNTSEVLIALSAESPTSVDLDLNYIVNNAGWEAVYDLRAIDTKSPIQLNYKANVFQATGENWNNVKLKLSTANPTLGGLKPQLSTWFLDFYQNDYRRSAGREMKKMSMPKSSPSEAPQAAEMEEDAGTIDQYTSTIQTTLNTEFSIGLPYTVLSSRKPTLVDIRNHEVKAGYVYAVAPKLDKDAFLIANATGWEDFSLLPGEANVFFEGTFVGATYIDPNSTKDTLEISLGRDKRIVVTRQKVKDFTSKKFIGSNRKESHAYEISIRNTKNEPIQIKVEDQLPVSTNSQIEVTILDVGGANHKKETGKLLWEMNLQPNETKKVIYKFEVKYPKDRVIAGLD
jgi:uncharacterized protein (TIGR02231 family)